MIALATRPTRPGPRLEHTLLCQCARRDAKAPSLLSDPETRIDWDVVLREADLHLVTELLLTPLKAAGRVPPAALERLERRKIEVTALNLARTRQLSDLLERLRAHGIRALSYKGPAMTVGFYGHLGLRWSADLDLLVDRRHASRVRPLMLADGYTLPPREQYRVGSLLYGLFPGAGRDDTLLPGQPHLAMVDVHVAFSYWTQGISLDSDALFDRAITVEVAGESIPTLCPDDLILVLALHGMMHGWSRLRLVSDIDWTVPLVVDWDAVIRRASQARMRRALWVALLLARDLLDTALPADVLALATEDRGAAAVVGRAAARLFDPAAWTEGWDPRPWFLSFQERPLDRLRYHVRRTMYEWFLKWPWDDWLGRRRVPIGSRKA